MDEYVQLLYLPVSLEKKVIFISYQSWSVVHPRFLVSCFPLIVSSPKPVHRLQDVEGNTWYLSCQRSRLKVNLCIFVNVREKAGICNCVPSIEV